jgi:hypothetical protein
MVSPENAQFIADYLTEVRLRDVLQGLINHPDLRAAAGAANRAKAIAEYDEGLMISRYKALYEGAMGRPGALG